MFAPIHYDAGIGFVAGGSVLAVLTVIIALFESLFMLLLRWDKFGRCLWVALLMNAVSTLFGGLLIALIGWGGACIWLLVSFVFSVLIEAGIMMLVKPGNRRQNWNASFSVNFMSYVFIILPCVIWPGIINFIAHIVL